MTHTQRRLSPLSIVWYIRENSSSSCLNFRKPLEQRKIFNCAETWLNIMDTAAGMQRAGPKQCAAISQTGPWSSPNNCLTIISWCRWLNDGISRSVKESVCQMKPDQLSKLHKIKSLVVFARHKSEPVILNLNFLFKMSNKQIYYFHSGSKSKPVQ